MMSSSKAIRSGPTLTNQSHLLPLPIGSPGQILEALNYLHSICKLIHRNLNPGNVLIASNGDNWKLSGLEFAIRFESATVHDSASIMAGELAGSTCLRYTGLASTSGAHSALRRQRTLVSSSLARQLAPSSIGASLTPATMSRPRLRPVPDKVRGVCQEAARSAPHPARARLPGAGNLAPGQVLAQVRPILLRAPPRPDLRPLAPPGSDKLSI